MIEKYLPPLQLLAVCRTLERPARLSVINCEKLLVELAQSWFELSKAIIDFC
jgi:hypothetical protein